jgi:DNA-binding NarL/FixJ family response regulator
MGGGAKWRERLDEVAYDYKLSPRQQEVMRLLLKGRDVKYIMSTFVISQATAKTHVYNLYRKLNVHSRRELLDLMEQTPHAKPPNPANPVKPANPS